MWFNRWKHCCSNQRSDIEIPVVVRLEGNNADLGSKILSNTKIKIESINDLAHASQKAVELAKWVF